MAILSRQAIEQLGLIQGADADHYRQIGYDLTVGAIYIPEDDELNQGARVAVNHEIPPHGIVLIFSREIVDVPEGVCGYAMPKTRLCEEGILVLNTGIVDPLYRGPVSGTAVNFRKTPYQINQGAPFLRLVFEEVSNHMPQHRQVPAYTAEAVQNYRNERMVRAQQYGASFLNLRPTTQRIAEKVTHDLLESDRRFLGFTIAGAALLFAILQVIPAVIPRLTFSEDAMMQRVREAQAAEFRGLQEQLGAQRILIEHLERRLESAERSATPKAALPRRQ